MVRFVPLRADLETHGKDVVMSTSLTRDELLILLIEECSEVIKAATKCLRFGYDSDHGVGYGKNDVVLSEEVGDLEAIIAALPLNELAKVRTRAGKIAKAETAKARYGTTSCELAKDAS